MKKKFWIGILTAVLLLNLLPGMTPSAAADDTSSTVISTWCYGCGAFKNFQVIGFIPTPISSTPDPVLHWATIKCLTCGNGQQCSGGSTDNGGIFKHTGGTETPTCTTGKTCEKCGGEYGKLGHDWGAWQSNGDNNTHTRSCQREGCNAVDTANCGGDGTATCVTAGTCTGCGGPYYGGHNFAKYRDSDANTHWYPCLNENCEARKDVADHWFVPGNIHLKSAATCISNAVYYTNCTICYYKGTDTYVYQ